jgi:hypothetical protein
MNPSIYILLECKNDSCCFLMKIYQRVGLQFTISTPQYNIQEIFVLWDVKWGTIVWTTPLAVNLDLLFYRKRQLPLDMKQTITSRYEKKIRKIMCVFEHTIL